MRTPSNAMSVAASNHEYITDGSGRGKCKWCDREVIYPPDGKGDVKIVKEGWAHMPKSPDILPLDHTQAQQPVLNPLPGRASLKTEKPPKVKRKIMKMTKELKARLLEVGPKQFCDEWGYNSRAMGLFVQMYRKLGGVWSKSEKRVKKPTKIFPISEEVKVATRMHRPTVSVSTKGGNHIKLVIELTIGGQE